MIKKIKCSKCKYWLPLTEFYKDKNTSTGKKSYCKACYKAHYGSKRKTKSNTDVIGVFYFNCVQCGIGFSTTKSNKVFCSDTCKKRNWYEQNRQTETGKKYGTKRNSRNFKNKTEENKRN